MSAMVYLFSLFFFVVYLFCGILFFYSFFFGSLVFEYFLFNSVGLDFSFVFVFDYLSLGFFSCVSFISGIVFIYSTFYMEGTVDSRRFYWLVFLFVVSMLLLVFSGNFLVTMVGWDGLGLVSFCLVIFYSNSSSLESGLVTVFSNRVGDVFFLCSFFFFFVGGVFNWDVLFSSKMFSIVIFFGAITKSAQVPFSAWLPAAMAAPTPVSSLVHSSTLVTAGVYVIIRFNYIFSFFMFNFFKTFFIFTMLLAGFSAVVESDFKKIVAMSTLSQLGMMMFILSVGAWLLSFVHMIVHAFFKSMLFLSTGSLMGQMGGTQDSRFYGGSLFGFCSFIYFVVSCFCLAGFPFFLGFYSKDFIITSGSYFEGLFYYFFFLSGCVFTVMYSIRLMFQSYLVMMKYSSFSSSAESVNFFFPVSFLFVKCWLLGGMLYWFFLFNLSYFFSLFDVFFGLVLCLVGYMFFLLVRLFYIVFYVLASILFLRWGATSLYSFFFPNIFYFFFDKSWMEYLGGKGVGFALYKSGSFLNFSSAVSLGLMIFVSLILCFYVY